MLIGLVELLIPGDTLQAARCNIVLEFSFDYFVSSVKVASNGFLRVKHE